MKTSLIAVILTLLLFPYMGHTGGKSGPILDVSLLELQKNGDCYNNRRVRVHGEYVTDYGHSVAFRDPKTKNFLVEIWLDLKDDSDIVKEYRNMDAADYVKLVTSGELKNILNDIAWTVPLPLKSLPAHQLRAIHKYWRKKEAKSAKITVIGRFDYATRGRLMMHRNGQISFTSGFGNGSKWPYRIVAEAIVLQED